MKPTHAVHSSSAGDKTKGFTLLEIMIVLTIIALLAIIAIPLFSKIREESRTTTVVNDFRIFSASFQTYELENGEWPNDRGPGILPTVMEDYIKEADFESPTGIGGDWDWEEGGMGITAGISIRNSGATVEQFTNIDETIDDGNLTTGQMRLTSGVLLYVLEE